MVVQMPDSTLDLGTGPGAGPKNFEILKFDNLTDFNVFSDMNDVGVKYDLFSDGNGC